MRVHYRLAIDHGSCRLGAHLRPAQALEILSMDGSPEPRARAALTSATPVAVLERLARDPEPCVRWALTQNEAVPARLLAALAADPCDRVRRGVAGHRATSGETLAVLARDACWLVREEVAMNQATPVGILLRVAATDPARAVRSTASRALWTAERTDVRRTHAR